MLKRGTNLDLNEPTAMRDDDMDRPIAVTWSLPPINYDDVFEGAEIAYDDPAPRNVLHLGQADALTT